MKASTNALLFILGLDVLAAVSLQRVTAQNGPASGDRVLTVPPGFVIERIAGPPLVDRPIVADFDEQGRLYVADSSGSSDKVDKQLADKPHRIVRLEDTNGDGVFDKQTVFADKMMFPEGTMWFDGSLYVAAPPSIWKLTDTDADGVADRREEWFQGKTLTGCANDLHGPYLGPDGWIYWTKGAFAQQTYEQPGKPPFVTRASHIFRRRANDPAIEVVMTGGMDNPVDVAFTTTGERIFTATFLEHPQAGQRDAVVHGVYGGVYGKLHAVLDGHKRTGDLMPVMAQLGPAVPAGLTRYASRVFGSEYQDSFYAAMFNLRKVSRFVLEPKGATFTAHESDFVVSTDRDFHPTDVLEDADGSLIVVDTGPWYKLCCPTSQLAKPDVLGAIYRVRRLDASEVRDPRGSRLDWNAMTPSSAVRLLDDPRTAVQNRVLQKFAKLGDVAVDDLTGVLKSSGSVEARRNAVWALTRIGGLKARAAVRVALADRDESVRRVALYSAGLWRDRLAHEAIHEALRSNSPAVQRIAAEASGRLGDARAIPGLIAAAAAPVDRVLEHSLTYALIEIDDPTATSISGLQAKTSQAKRATLIALDQMDGGGIKLDDVRELLDSADPVLKESAWWIAGHHPDWGNGLATFFQERLKDPTRAVAERDALQQRLAQFGDNPAMQNLLADLAERAADRDDKLTTLRAMAGAMRLRTKEVPATWVRPLAAAIVDNDVSIVREAISVVRASTIPKEPNTDLQVALLRVAGDNRRPLDLRLDALSATQRAIGTIDGELFGLLRAGLDANQPAPVRAAAASAIEKATLDDQQLKLLAESLRAAGPLELPRLLRAFDNSRDEGVGLAMIGALQQSKARASIRTDILRPRLAQYPAAVQKAGDALLASLNVDSTKQVQRLEELLASSSNGDVRRGQDVFNSSKAACATCHAIGYIGGKIGPDLTKIGQVRSERDLLEAVLFPSASFARGYEPVVVRTLTGEVQAGLLRSDQPDGVVLVTGDGQERRISRGTIADMQPGAVSLMPAGLDQLLTRQELADLVAFLKASR
jgi:putative membrane-bound dehydrogenase-like protein